MIGQVDDADRALLTLQLRPTATADARDVVVWVDTAFDGELVVPCRLIEEWGLTQTSAVQATLADGTTTILDTFCCHVSWFGEWRPVEIIANDGKLPLLGIGMMRQRRLVVDYRTRELTLE